MILRNYWWLLVWMFTGGVLLDSLMLKRREMVCEKMEKRWDTIPAVILVIPYIVWAGFRTDSFGDTSAYRITFQNAPTQLGQLGKYLTTITKDKGYAILTVCLKCIIGNSDILFFLIIASIQLFCIVYVCRKYSCNYWLSIFLFIASTDYISWMHNGMRQFLAITIIFAATELLIDKKYFQLIFIILLASTLHASMLFMIPVIFVVQGRAWNKKSVLCIIACIVALFFVDQFTDILDSTLSTTQYASMVTDWKEWEDDGTNPIRVLVYSIPMLLSIIGHKQIKACTNPLVHMTTNFSILAFGTALLSMGTSGIFIGRMIQPTFIYAILILLPWEVENIFTKESAKLMRIFTVVGYVGFFYYQMHFTWGLL